MHAFIGLLLYHLNSHSYKILCSDACGPPILSATMSCNRFQFLLAHLSLDNEETREERWKLDRFAAIQEFFEKFSLQCMTCMGPKEYLSLDEPLYLMRMQIGFTQYNPNKPAKYGLLFKSINSA